MAAIIAALQLPLTIPLPPNRPREIIVLPLSDQAVARHETLAPSGDREGPAGKPRPAALFGHSLGAGFCNTAAEAVADGRSIADQSGNRGLKILHGYICRANVLKKQRRGKLGL